ncbi:hypothetical protein K3495_g17018, partial [Podosphaera aphanis]
MTDQRHLFRGPLKRIKRVVIKVGGGNLFSEHQGLAKIECKDGTSALMRNVYFVPKLGVNLLSARKLCRNGMKGIFDETSIKIVHNKIPMIIAEQKDGLYVVKHVAKELKEKALFTLAEKHNIHVADLDSDPNPDSSEEEDPTTKAERHYYRIMHRRFAHCGPETLRKLHKVTTLGK